MGDNGGAGRAGRTRAAVEETRLGAREDDLRGIDRFLGSRIPGNAPHERAALARYRALRQKVSRTKTTTEIGRLRKGVLLRDLDRSIASLAQLDRDR